MKYPKHLLLDYGLDFKKSQTPYWGFKYVLLSNYRLSVSHKVFFKNSQNTKFKKKLDLQTSVPSAPHVSYDVFFLRKEKIYTKLKYSRCPQYDIVSGGLAALLAAFIGFLICEKFGLELLDSGDFYFAFMYGVFFCFSVRPLLRILDKDLLKHKAFSLKPLYIFVATILLLLIKFFKILFRTYLPYLYFKLILLSHWCSDNETIRPTLRWVHYWVRFLKNYPRKVE